MSSTNHQLTLYPYHWFVHHALKRWFIFLLKNRKLLIWPYLGHHITPPPKYSCDVVEVIVVKKMSNVKNSPMMAWGGLSNVSKCQNMLNCQKVKQLDTLYYRGSQKRHNEVNFDITIKLVKNTFHEHFKSFWWPLYLTSKLTSLCLNLIVSSYFFVKPVMVAEWRACLVTVWEVSRSNPGILPLLHM